MGIWRVLYYVAISMCQTKANTREISITCRNQKKNQLLNRKEWVYQAIRVSEKPGEMVVQSV